MRLYLSLIPEALIASMLPPEEFGTYYAVGPRNRTRGSAIFFEITDMLDRELFPFEELEKRSVPHPDGTPRRSVYLSVYRVLEKVPIEAFGRLYLVTPDGRTLGLDSKPVEESSSNSLHLYQEFCPVTPRIASRLDPIEFSRWLTDVSRPVSVPKLVFAELRLGDLAANPETGSTEDLPYPDINHLRDCLKEAQSSPYKTGKTVIRYLHHNFLFHTIETGFFLGDSSRILFYPLPAREVLEREYFDWWRSALTAFPH